MNWRLGIVAAILAGSSACSPCAGVGSCDSPRPRISMDGQIVRAMDGRGVDGIRIDAVWIGGQPVDVDSQTVVTSNGGFWHIETPTDGFDLSAFRFRVWTPLMAHPYIKIETTVPTIRKAEGAQLNRWLVDPYYPYYMQLYLRGDKTQIFPNIPVDFQQTTGPALRGAPDGIVHTANDATGWAQMFIYQAYASDTGEIGGIVTVHLSDALGTSTRTVGGFKPTFEYRAAAGTPQVAIGPSLAYAVAVVDSANRPVSGVRVDVARSGGIAVRPTSVSVTTNSAGRAILPFVALAKGTLTAKVTLTPPTGAAQTFSATFNTFDSDGSPLFATWTLGAVH
jgi:hypothetical protein